MSNPTADNSLYTRGLAVLEDHLGPVQALHFLALVSRQPFDYQRWRQQHFGGMSLSKILAQAQAVQTAPQRKKPLQ